MAAWREEARACIPAAQFARWMPQVGRGTWKNTLVADEVETRRSADRRSDNDNFFITFRRDHLFDTHDRVIYKID
jgi:hypothetical protein